MGRLFRYFVNLFEHDPRWLVRVTAAAGLGIAMALYVVLKERATISVDEVIATLIGIPASMTAAGLLLATADTIRRQLRDGQRFRRFSFAVRCRHLVGACLVRRVADRRVSVGDLAGQHDVDPACRLGRGGAVTVLFIAGARSWPDRFHGRPWKVVR